MKKRTFLLTTLILLSTSILGHAGSRVIDLAQEIDSALFISDAQINNYGDQVLGIVTKQIPQNRVVRYSIDGSESPKKLVKQSVEEISNDQILTGAWPVERSQVLIVINNQNVVSLFAKKIGNNYRFWSPRTTGGEAIFQCAAPAQALSVKPKNPSRALVENESWDGCLMPAEKITFSPGFVAPPKAVVSEVQEPVTPAIEEKAPVQPVVEEEIKTEQELTVPEIAPTTESEKIEDKK